MSEDFSKSAHFINNESQDQSFVEKVERALQILEALKISPLEEEYPALLSTLSTTIGTLRAIVDEEKRKGKWKPWKIGERVQVMNGPYTGMQGRLIGTIHQGTSTGMMLVDLDEIGQVEIGPTFLQGV